MPHVDLWLAELPGVRPYLPQEVTILDAYERARARQFATPGLAERYVSRALTLRYLLQRYLGVPAPQIAISRRCHRCGHPSHGKPRVLDGRMEINVSSSGSVCLVAVSSACPVGVDVELDTWVARDVLDLAGAEYNLSGDPAHDRAEALRAWVRHEALCKGLGAGLPPVLTASERELTRSWSVVDVEADFNGAVALATPVPADIALRRWPSGERLRASPSRQILPDSN